MSTRVQSPCAMPGCPGRNERGGYCSEHAKTQDNRPRRGQSQYGTPHRRMRKMVLARNPVCPCGQPATVYDHVTPQAQGGDNSFENAQGLCERCHNAKTAREDGGLRIGAGTVTIVCGPPGSGKSSYVQQHRKRGDLIVDLDSIKRSISGEAAYDTPDALLGYALAVRDCLISRIAGRRDVNAWIIGTLADRPEREALAQRTRGRKIGRAHV